MNIPSMNIPRLKIMVPAMLAAGLLLTSAPASVFAADVDDRLNYHQGGKYCFLLPDIQFGRIDLRFDYDYREWDRAQGLVWRTGHIDAANGKIVNADGRWVVGPDRVGPRASVPYRTYRNSDRGKKICAVRHFPRRHNLDTQLYNVRASYKYGSANAKARNCPAMAMSETVGLVVSGSSVTCKKL